MGDASHPSQPIPIAHCIRRWEREQSPDKHLAEQSTTSHFSQRHFLPPPIKTLIDSFDYVTLTVPVESNDIFLRSNERPIPVNYKRRNQSYLIELYLFD